MKTATKLKSIHLIVLSVLIHFYAVAQEESAYLQQLGLKDSLYSNALSETRTIYVQLPRGYNHDSQQEYPVVYLLDGEMLLPALSSV